MSVAQFSRGALVLACTLMIYAWQSAQHGHHSSSPFVLHGRADLYFAGNWMIDAPSGMAPPPSAYERKLVVTFRRSGTFRYSWYMRDEPVAPEGSIHGVWTRRRDSRQGQVSRWTLIPHERPAKDMPSTLPTLRVSTTDATYWIPTVDFKTGELSERSVWPLHHGLR